MIRVALILSFIILVMFFAPYMLGQKGYVLIAMGNYTIEMTVISLTISLIIGLIGFLLLEWVIKRAFGLSSAGKGWFVNRKSNRAKADLKQGLLALVEQDWQLAKKHLLRSVDSAENPVVNYLYAAEAARQLKEEEQVESLLANAVATGESELLAKCRYFEQRLNSNKEVLTEINEFQQQHPKHQQLIRLKIRALQQQSSWLELLEFIPQVKSAIGKTEFQKLQHNSYSNSFSQLATKEGALGLKEFWKKLPRKLKSDIVLNSAFVEALIEQGDSVAAEQHLLPLLKKSTDTSYVKLLHNIKLQQPLEMIQLLEKKLKQQPDELDLLRALGHLAANSSDLSLAQKVLHKVCKLSEESQDWIKLAQVAEAVDDKSLALDCYKQAAQY